MLTGDSKAAGESIAKEIGLDPVYTELLPHQKVLARSDVGIAMGGLAPMRPLRPPMWY
jgi:cation transport ATPase